MQDMESVIFAWIWCYQLCSALEQRVAVTGTRVSLTLKKITNYKRNFRLQPLVTAVRGDRIVETQCYIVYIDLRSVLNSYQSNRFDVCIRNTSKYKTW